MKVKMVLKKAEIKDTTITMTMTNRYYNQQLTNLNRMFKVSKEYKEQFKNDKTIQINKEEIQITKTIKKDSKIVKIMKTMDKENFSIIIETVDKDKKVKLKKINMEEEIKAIISKIINKIVNVDNKKDMNNRNSQIESSKIETVEKNFKIRMGELTIIKLE